MKIPTHWDTQKTHWGKCQRFGGPQLIYRWIDMPDLYDRYAVSCDS